MKRGTVKKIFWFFILFLPVQYALVGIIGPIKSEPWPAFVLPGFKTIYQQRDEIILKQVHFYAVNKNDSIRLNIAPETLFKEISQSQLLGFLKTNFADSAKIEWSPSTQLWMKKRLAGIYPSQNNLSLQVHWVAETYQYADSHLEPATAQTIKSFIIPLDSGRK